MSYEKPELFVLNLAANCVRGGSGGDGDAAKQHAFNESGSGGNDTGDGHNNTSTSSAAYEADE